MLEFTLTSFHRKKCHPKSHGQSIGQVRPSSNDKASPATFPYFGTLWQKTMTLGRKEKAIDYLRPCSKRLSTFSIWYWGEPAIKHTPKLNKRWKKHTFLYQTGIKKIRREARKHLVSSYFDRETNSIWLNQRKEQVAHDLNDQAMKSSFVDLKLKWRREWSRSLEPGFCESVVVASLLDPILSLLEETLRGFGTRFFEAGFKALTSLLDRG